MAIQKSVTLRNAQLDAWETVIGTTAKLRIATGSAPADCATADSGTELITITLPSDWMAAASGGTKAKSGTWSGTATGGTASTPGHWRLKDNAGTTVHAQGTAGIGSGDLSFDGSITSGQVVTITTFTLTAGGA
jgi:hypothetical protein